MRLILPLLILFGATLPFSVRGQCVGLPSVTSLGSNKFPTGLCAPVQANVTYTVAFVSPVTSGSLEVIYDWGDGTPAEIVALTTGSKSYNAERTHTYPVDSDCEYFVTMSVWYNGKVCTNTIQTQRISSWRTDQFNGGEVRLISPATNKNVHLVCEGEDISAVFDDKTNWNCNTAGLLTGSNGMESPNGEYRWQQIVYNTSTGSSKIPNVSVDGVAVTGANGADIRSRYEDPRGVLYMSAPVVVDDARRRSTLRITAPGGFGAGYPKAGDAFAVTLRYWNVCNPYDDPEIPGPPADIMNGDHPPVERSALIQVVAPPPALKGSDETVCYGTTPSAFSVTGVGAGNIVNWYRYVEGSNIAGALIRSSTATSLPVTSHPDWRNSKTPGVLRAWVSQRSNTAGATNCESPKILVTRVIREELTVPAAITSPPAEICNGQTFTVTMRSPATETVGGETEYAWTGSAGITVTASDETRAAFAVNVTDFGSALFADRTVTVGRRYKDSPLCGSEKKFTVRIFRDPQGGLLRGLTEVCENSPVGAIALTGYTGVISRWEVKKDGGTFGLYTGAGSGSEISPGVLSPGGYTFRALVGNGPCGEVASAGLSLRVWQDPGKAQAGNDQFICNELQSAALNANVPVAGTGSWTYISSVPSGLPAPSFRADDANTTVLIDAANAGVYTLRWTLTNGSCQSADDVLIDFGTNPTDPLAGPDRSVCGSSTLLEGNTPLKGQGTWTVVDGPGGCAGNACGVTITSPSSATSAVALNGASPVFGAYTFRWSISSGGNNCFLKSDEVTVTFEEPISISAGDVTGICLDRDNPEPVEVTGIVIGPVADAQWVQVTGAGLLSSTTWESNGGEHTVKAVYQPSTPDYEANAPVQLKLTATPLNASCAPLEKTVTIQVERKPIAAAGSGIPNICDPFVALDATSPDAGLTGLWTTTSPDVSFDDLKDPRTVVRNLPVGTTILSWTVTGAGGCQSRPSSITLTRVARPVATDLEASACAGPAGTASILLPDYEDQITSLTSANRDISWFRRSGAVDHAVVDPSVPQTGVGEGQIFIARIRDVATGCTSDAKVTIDVRALPSVRDAVMSRCEDVAGSMIVSGLDLSDAEFTSAVTPASNVDVAWYNSEADALAKRFPIVAPVMVNKQKEFYGLVTYRDKPSCEALGRVNIVVNPQPAIAAIVGREAVCQGVSSSPVLEDYPVHVYQVTPIPGAKYYWDIPDDAGSEFKVFGGGRQGDFYVLLQFPNVFTGKIRVRAELNGCSGPVVEKQISVSASPSKPLIDGPAVVCERDGKVAFSVRPDNYPSSAYNWEVRRVSDGSAGGADIMEGQLTGNVLINFGAEDVVISVRESNAECVSPVATKVIKVADPPKATLSIDQEITCFMANDGVISTAVAGGSAPFRDFQIIETGAIDGDGDGVFRSLAQGSYRVRLTDANGCVAVSNVQVLKQPDPVVIDRVEVPFDQAGFNVSCAGAEDGQVTAFFSGGNSAGDYTVSLMKYNSLSAPRLLTGRGSVSFTGLDAGTYSIAVEDETGCSAVPAIAFVVSPPALYGGAIGPDQVLCSGEDPLPIGELAPPEGGTGTYDYEWQESATGNVYDDGAWTSLPGQDGPTFDPPAYETSNALGTQRYYRRLVKSVSWFNGVPQACEVKGKTEKVTITFKPKPEVLFTAQSAEVCEGDALAVNLTLTKGRAPVTFDYAVSSATFPDQRGPIQTLITVPDLRKDASVSLLRLVDANGCAPERMPEAINVKVIAINPAFTITRPDNACNGGEYIFTWNAVPGISYRWEWGDGRVTALDAGATGVGENRLTHAYQAVSALKATEYEVKLFAGKAGCIEKAVSQRITIPPAIRLNISAADTLLCSGEEAVFYNNSTGMDRARWYYRDPSSGETVTPKFGERNERFVFHNTTSVNPVIYEVGFEAENDSGCREVYKQNVYVFRSNVASFAIDSIPPFEGQPVSVKVRNTSEVLDGSQFNYLWSYGEHSAVNEPSTEETFKIVYYSPGVKDIRLSIVNLAASAMGKSCESVHEEQITIPVQGLEASFSAGPFTACLPAMIKIENTTRGADAFLWQVFRGDTLVSTSNLRYPEFTIMHPGVYDIRLTASVTSADLESRAEVRGLKVFDMPGASFEVRSGLLYVPDTEMEVMNFSMGANLYEWDFGDGHTSAEFEPRHAFQQDGSYSVVLRAGYDHGMVDIDGDGKADRALVCYDTAVREVRAMNGGDLKIPNAFTPDTRGEASARPGSEGINDVFLPSAKGIQEFHMQIYDRWGVLVFESRDQAQGWAGYDRNNRLLPAGVYVYKIVVRTSAGDSVTRAGDVTLIR